jgi:hypothetical protein
MLALLSALAGCDKHLTRHLQVVESGDSRQLIYFDDRLQYEGHILATVPLGGDDYVFFVNDIGDLKCRNGFTSPGYDSRIKALRVDAQGGAAMVDPRNYPKPYSDAKTEIGRMQAETPHFFEAEGC